MADPQTSPPAKVDDVKLKSAEAALKLYVDLINSERQAIWARNAAMLVGNSFIINAIRSELAGSEPGLNLLFSLAGIAICGLWAIMTWAGWTWYHNLMLAARKLAVPDEFNPFSENGPLAARHPARHRDKIFWCTMLVIALFAAMYVASIAYGAGYVFWLTPLAVPENLNNP